MTELYEQINASLAAVTGWYDTNEPYLTWLGLIHNKTTTDDLDTLIAAYQSASNWNRVAFVKRIAELIGYTSETIDNAVKAFLTNMPMFTNYSLPKNYSSSTRYAIAYPYTLYGYRWAEELDWETDRWDAQDGYDGLKYCFDLAQADGKVFHDCNADTGAYNTLGGGRMYEANQLGNSFWIFYNDCGIAEALNDVASCWTWMNDNLWVEAQGYFKYNVASSGWVWDGPAEALAVFGRLSLEDPLKAPNIERFKTHLENGYINSAWNSKHFVCGSAQYHYTPHLNSNNAQRRTAGTMLSFAFITQMSSHYYLENYRLLWCDMINGTGIAHAKGWKVMLESYHGMYNSTTKQFRFDSNLAFSNVGTAWACLNLFLLGISISPDYPRGGIAIPLETLTLGSCTMFDPTHFQWDGDNHKIRIPVFSGWLVFHYGNTPLEQEFLTDGIYEITFNATYTAIDDVEKLDDLTADFVYLEPTIRVVTLPPTDKAHPTIKLNGFVNKDTVERGFEWGETKGGPYPNSWTEAGVFPSEAFDHTAGAFEKGMNYYCRAKAKPTADGEWSYGDEETFFFPMEASDGWLVDFLYRKSHTISQTVGAGTNYQVGIKVYYGSGTDGTETVDLVSMGKVYCDELCKSDFGDIRFTADDGETELSYYIETKVDSSYAIFWVKITDDLDVGESVIYVYFGNAEASTTSSLSDTFIFSDDFETNLDKWTVGGTCTLSTEKKVDGSKSVKCGVGASKITKNPAPNWTNVAVHVKWYDNVNLFYDTERHVLDCSGVIVSRMGVDENYDNWNNSYVIDTTYRQLAARVTTWHRLVIRCSTDLKEFIFDGTKGTVDGAENLISSLILGSQWADTDLHCYYDQLFVRKYISPEPEHNVWGEQETATTTAITNDASNVEPFSVKLHGRLCLAWGYATIRGFQWGTESGVYTDETFETGGFASGTYDSTITTEQNTKYYFRAFCVKDGEWFYGDELEFETSIAPTNSLTINSDPTNAEFTLEDVTDGE